MSRDSRSFRSFTLFTLLLAVALLAGALVPLALSGCTALPEGVPLAYVAVGGGNHVRVIDLDRGATLRRLYTGAGPWRLELSPDGRRLWIQHWYAGLTTVLDLNGHEAAATLPLRGPGTFSAEGDAFLSFHWPDGKLHTVDPRTFVPVEARPTEVRQVYDLMPTADGDALYLVQYDPMGRGRTQRYGYLVRYPYKQDAEKAVPASLPTGVSPVGLAAVPGQPFFLSVDSGTNGLSLLNERHDGRAVAACPAPRDVAFHSGKSGEVDRMAAICWLGDGHPWSEAVVFATDFTARPWPEMDVIAHAKVPGGLSAAAFSSDPDRLWVTDRTGGRLLELAVVASASGDLPGELEIRREIETGAVPLDLVIRTVTVEERDRIAQGKTRGRQLAEQTLERRITEGEPFSGLTWDEAILPSTEDGAQGGEAEDGREQPPPLRWSLRPPDALRVEHGEGFRLARDGHSLTVDGWGRFWTAPRQELLAVVYALPALTVEEAVRRLAGDVVGSPWLSGGLAMDLATEVEEKDGARSILIGADRPGLRVAQLWVDAESGQPTTLLEQLPNFEPVGDGFHGGASAAEMVETRFLGFTRVDGRLWMPSLIERWVEGRRGPQVRLERFRLSTEGDTEGAPETDLHFDLARLGGARPAASLFTGDSVETESSGPGRSVPISRTGPELAGSVLPGPMPPRVAYPSNPPVSGPHLPYAADWGFHEVPVPLPLQVHNLLDGGVALQWSCPRGCPDLVKTLESYAREKDRVLAAPFPWLSRNGEREPRLALTAWGRIELLEAFDRDRIDAFVETWGGKDHHAEVDGGH